MITSWIVEKVLTVGKFFTLIPPTKNLLKRTRYKCRITMKMLSCFYTSFPEILKYYFSFQAFDRMGQATSHNHHGSNISQPHGDRPRSIGGSGVNFGSQQGHAGVTDSLKDGSPFDGQVAILSII
jgi:hypothetical protein